MLTPGGLLLLAFQVGDEPLVLTDAFGESVHLTYRRRQPRMVEDYLVRPVSGSAQRVGEQALGGVGAVGGWRQ